MIKLLSQYLIILYINACTGAPLKANFWIFQSIQQIFIEKMLFSELKDINRLSIDASQLDKYTRIKPKLIKYFILIIKSCFKWLLSKKKIKPESFLLKLHNLRGQLDPIVNQDKDANKLWRMGQVHGGHQSYTMPLQSDKSHKWPV